MKMECRMNPVTNLVNHISETFIDALTIGLESEFESRCEAVKSDDWKVIYSRMEMDEAWMNGFKTALALYTGYSDDGLWDFSLAEKIKGNMNKIIKS